jgi:hypothetical protein
VKVYVAGSSDEITRAVTWMRALESEGVDVVSTWPSVIATVGVANPSSATPDQRARWSSSCMREVSTCDVLWILAPNGSHGRGAYAELGAAWAWGKRIVASGPTRQSIFCGLADEYPSDEPAFRAIVGAR